MATTAHDLWVPSLAFRRFRRQHTELSRLYWTTQLGVDALTQAGAALPPDQQSVSALHGTFPNGLLPLKVGELMERLPTMLGRIRLHLLLVCAASLEAYIKDVAFLHVGADGHLGPDMKLDAVGKALASPILDRASLPEPLKYAEDLFGVTYGAHMLVWQRGYKLRSALAHSGGVVTPRTRRELPDIKTELGVILELSWPELKKALDAADQIATLTDKSVSTYKLRVVEAEREIRDLAESRKLPQRRVLWSFLHEKLSIQGIKRKDKVALEARYYAR